MKYLQIFYFLFSAPLVITPRVGSVLGGTVVSISSMCLEETDTIICEYEGFDVIFADIQEPDTDNEAITALCVSPAYPRPGSYELRVIVVTESGETKYNSITQFYAGVYVGKLKVAIYT